MTLLSKDEFIACLHYIDSAAYTQAYIEKAVAHDQAQRAVIARLEAEHKDLVLRNKLLRDRPDLPLERIQAYDEVITKIEQQAKEIESHKKGCFRSHPHEEMNEVCELKTEIARLKNELSHWTWVRFKQLEEENKTLREALQLLYDTQNGCPLQKYEAGWRLAMQLTEQALKEVTT